MKIEVHPVKCCFTAILLSVKLFNRVKVESLKTDNLIHMMTLLLLIVAVILIGVVIYLFTRGKGPSLPKKPGEPIVPPPPPPETPAM